MGMKYLSLLFLMSFSSLSFAFPDQNEWFQRKCLVDVKRSVESLKQKGIARTIYAKEEMFPKSSYSMSWRNRFGIDNHFQGIYYSFNQDAYLITGGNKKTKTGSIFLSQKNQKTRRQELTKEFLTPGAPTLWHAGGLGDYGHMMIVPVERLSDPLTSKIYFYDYTKITEPKILDTTITVDHTKTGSVGVYYSREIDRLVLIAFDTGSITIYHANTPKVEDGFKMVKIVDSKVFTGSNIKILQQCDGKLFFAEATNRGLLPPLINGKNEVKLFEINPKTYEDTLVLKRSFKCDKRCNFRGAVNIQVGNNRIHLLSSKMYRTKGEPKIYLRHFFDQKF